MSVSMENKKRACVGSTNSFVVGLKLGKHQLHHTVYQIVWDFSTI